MDFKVIIKAYSGETMVSSRELDLETYYDGDIPEIDDSDFIISNKIDRVEQHTYDNGSYTAYINYYDENGSAYKFDEIKHY